MMGSQIKFLFRIINVYIIYVIDINYYCLDEKFRILNTIISRHSSRIAVDELKKQSILNMNIITITKIKT